MSGYDLVAIIWNLILKHLWDVLSSLDCAILQLQCKIDRFRIHKRTKLSATQRIAKTVLWILKKYVISRVTENKPAWEVGLLETAY